MKAFIIAGGEGTRLRPYTYYTPKPMLRVGGKPILEYVIINLKRNGIRDIVITVGEMHEQIRSYFGDGNKWGVKIEFAVERERKNTAGSILPYKNSMKERFVVVMGDHLTNINIKRMIEHHIRSKAIATIALCKNNLVLEYGVADVNNEGLLTRLREKPLIEHLYNAAIYVFEPRVFEYIEECEDFAKDVLPRLLNNKRTVATYVFDDVWFDIGRVSEYEELNKITKMVQLFKALQTEIQ